MTILNREEPSMGQCFSSSTTSHLVLELLQRHTLLYDPPPPFLRQFDRIMFGLGGSALMALTRGEIMAANFLLMCPLLYNDTKCSISQRSHEFVITTYRFPSVSRLREQHTVLTTASGPITRCGIVSSLPAATLPNELQLSPMGSVFQSAISQRSIPRLLP